MPEHPTQPRPRPPLGLIEGFFGRTWSWSARLDAVDFLARAGYDFYLYAPKADAHLRRRWQTPWPEDEWRALTELRRACRRAGLRFGVGLSPLELYREPAAEARAALTDKVRRLNALEPDLLGLLFDDMRGDLPALAARQAELAHTAATASTARQLILCPTYYSPDPVLEKVFGTRPPDYWQDLGRALDPTIEIFWTGPEVCSRQYPTEHLSRVTDWLGRRPFLWDNYPVNDSAGLCQHLRLAPYPRSHADIGGQVAGHAVNPMNQPYLSRLPLATLPPAYRLGADYCPRTAWERACRDWLPDDLRQALQGDAERLQTQGLAALDNRAVQALKARFEPYARRGDPQAVELLDWLAGGYAFDPACLTE